MNLDPTIGSDLKKTRLLRIICSHYAGMLPLRIIVPIPEWKDRYSVSPWSVKLEPNAVNGLNKESGVDCVQIRCVDVSRFGGKVGDITANDLDSIARAIGIVSEVPNS